MKVLFVLASNSKSSYSENLGFRIPPLSVAYLATIARSEGCEVKFIDGVASNLKVNDLIDRAISYDPDIVGLVMNSSTSHNASLRVAEALKKTIDPLILAGGHHATFTYTLILKSGVVDLVVLGEGEETFRDILRRAVKRGEPLTEISGIAFTQDGEIKVTKLREFIENLDDLPMPMYEIYQRNLYGIDILEPNAPVAPVETSRGCPYGCDFCSVTRMWGARWRLKSVNRVLEEIRNVIQLGFKWVFFIDDNFIVPTKTGLTIKVELLEKLRGIVGGKLRGIVQLRADLVVRNPWLVQKLKEAGIRISFIGLESGDPETLKKMKKGDNIDIGVKAVKMLSEAGIIVYAGFVLGAPYEDFRSIKRTLKYARELVKYGLDAAHFSIYTPLPGTFAFEKAVAEGRLLTLDFDLYDCLTPVMKTKVPPLKLFITQRLASYLYYFRKALSSLKGRIVGLCPEKDEFKEYLERNAIRYFTKNIHKYIIGFIMIPIEGIKISIKLKRSKIDRKVLDECINACRSFLYR